MSDEQNPAIRSVTVVLTNDELRERADQLVAAMSEQELVEGEKKAAVSVFKERIDAIEGRVHTLKLCIENRAEERKVECLMEADYRAGEMHFIHPETKAVLGKRPLEAEEYQTEISGASGNKAPAEPDVLAAGQPFQSGTCRYCRCDEEQACVVDEETNKTCGWLTENVDQPKTVCSTPECVKEHEDSLAQAKKVTPIGSAAAWKKKGRGRPPGSKNKNGKPTGDGGVA